MIDHPDALRAAQAAGDTHGTSWNSIYHQEDFNTSNRMVFVVHEEGPIKTPEPWHVQTKPLGAGKLQLGVPLEEEDGATPALA